MSKTLKVIISGVIAIVIGYFAYFIFNSVRYSYSIEMRNYKACLWVFKDSIRKDIDTNRFVGCIRKRDVLYHYIYKNTYDIFIWEFKDLDIAELNKIAINQNANLDNIKFSSGEILNKKDSPEMTVKFGVFFNYTMNVNLDEYSKVEKSFEAVHYKGFYGTINKMSFSNEKGEHLILFDYPSGKEPSLFLLYKGHKSFYIIVINTEKPFDESIINILNLS